MQRLAKLYCLVYITARNALLSTARPSVRRHCSSLSLFPALLILLADVYFASSVYDQRAVEQRT